MVIGSPQRGDGAANVFLCHFCGKSFENDISIRGSSKVWRTAPAPVARGRPISFSITVGVPSSPFPSGRPRTLASMAASIALISGIAIRVVHPFTSRPSGRRSCIILNDAVSAQIQSKLHIYAILYPSGSPVEGHRDTRTVAGRHREADPRTYY